VDFLYEKTDVDQVLVGQFDRRLLGIRQSGRKGRDERIIVRSGAVLNSDEFLERLDSIDDEVRLLELDYVFAVRRGSLRSREGALCEKEGGEDVNEWNAHLDGAVWSFKRAW
jgi:hypothetical protein